MDKDVKFRELLQGEEENACRLIKDCFSYFIAPGYSPEGITEFLKYITPQFTKYRLTHNHFMIVALDNSVMVGVIEVRNNNHISLFFVKQEYINKGIGKKLHELAIDKCKALQPDVTVIEVHSSPYAVPIYEKLGFVKVNTEQIKNGIKFTPMALKIS